MANKSTNKKQIVVVEESPKVAVKRILKSKTIWINAIALLSFAIEKHYGFLVDQELQLEILSLINIGLRFITHEKLVWGGKE